MLQRRHYGTRRFVERHGRSNGAERSAWTYVSQVEQGHRSISVDALRRIGDTLRVPAWRLLAEADDQTE
jgi:hypothetical protein